MRDVSYLYVIVLVFFSSCVDTDSDNALKVNIGETQANIVLKKFDPPILVTSSNPDSLDVDGDSQYDFTFIKSTVPLKTGFGLVTQIKKRLGIQIVLSTINNYPDTLSYSSALDNQANWSDNKSAKLVLQGYSCPGISQYCILTGNFINSKERYLGFRISERYGWLKIANNEFGDLKIEEYAISK